jgi:hypothetical protein
MVTNTLCLEDLTVTPKYLSETGRISISQERKKLSGHLQDDGCGQHHPGYTQVN